MVWVVVEDVFEMFDCLFILVKLVQNFGEAKVSWNALRFQFNAVSEILLSFLELTGVGQLSGQVNGRAKMCLVLQKYLLEMIYGLLQLLLPFIGATKVEM